MLPRQLRMMAALLVTVATSGLGASVSGLAQPPQSANPQKGSGETAAKEDPFAPMVKIQDEDYAKVRSLFRTKLTRNGPSPQPWSAVKPPAGVSEIRYVSGELRLKAWVNRPADEDRKHPAVLFLHGGFAFGAPDDWDVSQPYRDAGFIVPKSGKDLQRRCSGLYNRGTGRRRPWGRGWPRAQPGRSCRATGLVLEIYSRLC